METMREKESVGVERVREELARAREVLEKKRREVEEAKLRVTILEEQLGVLEANKKVEMKVQVEVEVEEEVEEQVEAVGAVTLRDGGDQRALPTLWPPKALPAGSEERLLAGGTCFPTYAGYSGELLAGTRHVRCTLSPRAPYFGF